ncbi:unnamed protein product [Calypogeia fissa]
MGVEDRISASSVLDCYGRMINLNSKAHSKLSWLNYGHHTRLPILKDRSTIHVARLASCGARQSLRRGK